MPRKPYTHHYIYKTTCNVTNRFYIGMHSTSNLEDGYLGSGKRLWNSINKHGRENHSIEILEYFENRELLKAREKELVNEDLLNDKMCMNLQSGGGGGISNQIEWKKTQSLGGSTVFRLLNARHQEKLINNIDYRNKYSQIMRNSKLGEKNAFFGKKHSKEFIEKIGKKTSLSQNGNKNSQYGKMWIKHVTLGNKSIKKEEFEMYEKEGWIKGRKIR